jgi:hypothetical protein
MSTQAQARWTLMVVGGLLTLAACSSPTGVGRIVDPPADSTALRCPVPAQQISTRICVTPR